MRNGGLSKHGGWLAGLCAALIACGGGGGATHPGDGGDDAAGQDVGRGDTPAGPDQPGPGDTTAEAGPGDAAAGDSAGDGQIDAGGPDGGAGDALAPDSGRADAAPGDAAPPDGLGDSAAADADATAPPDGIATWCARYATAYCGLLARCPLPGNAAPEPDACVAAAVALCGDGALAAAALAAGRLTFDTEAAAACESGLAALSCADFATRLTTLGDAPLPVCWTVVAGTGNEGAPCPLGSECAPGLRCTYAAGCPGRCTGYVGPGGACDFENLCDFRDAACLGGHCLALPAGVGTACPDGLCRSPLVCNQLTATCQPLRLAGEACGADGGLCYPGLACFRASPAEMGSCRALGTTGDACFDDTQCNATGPAGVLVCAGGRCTRAPEAGAPCLNFRCNDAVCDTAALPPTCLPLPGPGETCWFGYFCAAGLFCDAGLCQSQRAAGAACTQPQQCASGRCPAGACVAPGAPACTP